MEQIIEISFEKALNFKPYLSFLIVVATKVEKEEVLRNLTPIPEEESILQTCNGNCTYYLGCFSGYLVAVVKTQMGAVGSEGSMMTTTTSISDWEPKAIVMLGIAFGVNKKNQNIGDVLISDILIQYESKKVNKDNKKIHRAESPKASIKLLNRFSEVTGWNHELPQEKFAKIIRGQMLTGEVLIDNLDYRNDLLEQYPEAKGGEMEGSGIYGAANSKNIDWIIVKGICDFADGKKSNKKKENQSIAIKSAVSLAYKVFESRYAFKDLSFIYKEDYLELREKDRLKNTSQKKK